MEELCPDAWMLNLTNPMTTICRSVTRETSVKTVGLCHEIAGAQFALSQLLDCSFLEITPTVAGVNHLPFITALDVGGNDGIERLREVLAGDDPSKADLIRQHRVKLELFERFGVLPGAGDRHVVEFFSGLPHRGVGVGQAVGRAPHHDRGARAGSGAPRQGVRAVARGRHGVGVAVGRDGGAGDRVLRARRTGLVPAQPPQPRPGGRPPRRGHGREHLRRRRQGPARPRRGAAPAHDGRVPAPGVGVAGADGRGRGLRQPRQGGRGDAPRPARRAHRLRPARRDDRRDARGDEAWLPQFASV